MTCMHKCCCQLTCIYLSPSSLHPSLPLCLHTNMQTQFDLKYNSNRRLPSVNLCVKWWYMTCCVTNDKQLLLRITRHLTKRAEPSRFNSCTAWRHNVFEMLLSSQITHRLLPKSSLSYACRECTYACACEVCRNSPNNELRTWFREKVQLMSEVYAVLRTCSSHALRREYAWKIKWGFLLQHSSTIARPPFPPTCTHILRFFTQSTIKVLHGTWFEPPSWK